MVGVSMNRCGVLLKELQNIWAEIGETEAHKERILLEIERECLGIYQNKVDEANEAKAQLHQCVTAKEAEVAALMAALGEHKFQLQKGKKPESLKGQLAFVTSMLENLIEKKEQRIKQFSDLRFQIQKISAELTESEHEVDTAVNSDIVEEHDLSTRKLNEFHLQLRSLQKEKSDRVHKVLDCVNEVHSLCALLGIDFMKTVDEVHPSLHETMPGQSTNISNTTLRGLEQTIQRLKAEKKVRIQKLREIIQSLYELWKLMDSPEEEGKHFSRMAHILEQPEHDITLSGLLSYETIKQTEAEVERLTKLKASRMKELVFKRRSELEEVCRRAHIEPDTTTAPDRTAALIDSGLVDPLELLANIEAQIVKANEESQSRKEIMDRISKWQAACDEENWLEEYNLDSTKYTSGRGGHLNLRRAEKARILVSKIPAIVDYLIARTFDWEDEKKKLFLYDGVRLVSILEEYKLNRQQREEEERRYRDHKKLQALMDKEREAILGSKLIPKRRNSLNGKPNGYHVNGSITSSPRWPSSPRRPSAGSATPPRSYSGGRDNGYLKEMRRLSTAPLNFVAVSKEDSMFTFTSMSGSEHGSPPPW